MSFYSLDGSKVHNDLFDNKQIYENFNGVNEDVESFGDVPNSSSNATDTAYQCSDNYAVSGTTYGNTIFKSNLAACKTECLNAGNNCIGFNFNSSDNSCTLKQNANSLTNSSPSNTLCVKKAAGGKNCKIKNTSTSTNEAAFNELNSIFKPYLMEETHKPYLMEETHKPYLMDETHKEIHSPSCNIGNVSLDSESPIINLISKINKLPQPEQNEVIQKLYNPNYVLNTVVKEQPYPLLIPKPEVLTNKIEQRPETEYKQIINSCNVGNNYDSIYVDLECFMNNINVLQHHTDNMMIDLSLLLSNIKSCSYIKKNQKSNTFSSASLNESMNNFGSGNNGTNGTSLSHAENIVNQITSKIDIPQPDIIKLKNLHASIVVTNPSEQYGTGQFLQITKEPFKSLQEYNTIPTLVSENYYTTVPETSSLNSSEIWSGYELLKVMVLVIILIILIFQK